MDIDSLIQQHQLALAEVAEEKSRLWWEKYVKGAISFRGVGIPQNRELLANWRKDNGINLIPYWDQLDLAVAFFDPPFAEDKIAGILYLQEYLYDKLPWVDLVASFDHLYTR